MKSICLYLVLFVCSLASIAVADVTIVSATLVGNKTVRVLFSNGELKEWGRNQGESLAAFKARVKASVAEVLVVANLSPTETDVTADIQ